MRINQQLKLVVALSIVIVFFIFTTILVPINSDSWQYSFFALTMVVVVTLNVGAAVFQGGLFGLSAQFPSKYLSAVLSGQALGAVFACLCSEGVAKLRHLKTVQRFTYDHMAAAVNSALVYFTLADITLLISMVAFLWMTKTAFYQFYTSSHGTSSGKEGATITTALSGKKPSINVWKVFLKIKWYALSVCLVFVVTLAMFPAITAKIRPMYTGTKEHPSIWARDYFVPVCCFLLFNLTDYLGRIAGGYTVWPKKHHWYFVLLLVALRVVFVPLFMYCHIDHKNLTTVFNHDAYYIIFMTFFGLSNGYLATLCMIYGPG
ncbi:Equilibrative nucleoside transporter 1 [Amphibalanus amphitrite]|uniref:Equilibrative nucleoside transporter 1 n=1 Tax=Amphibalanus amphitrite TaxID=1232801 RepID=A0A6A4XE59_AMPAM|nr:Equilibrative nucleoside transporter 1 [Amphibalanus amphitrite]